MTLYFLLRRFIGRLALSRQLTMERLAEVRSQWSDWCGGHWVRYTALTTDKLSHLMLAPLLLFSRLVAVIVIPSQLPGNVGEMVDELMASPIATIRSWPRATVWAITKQLIMARKLEIPDDPSLKRLFLLRTKFTMSGWEQVFLSSADGVRLDAVVREPPLDSPGRFILFVGGNFQKYEEWLWFFDMYAQEAGAGFMAFNFRGVGRSEGAVRCAGDLVNDVSACVDFLLARPAVTPEKVVLHGFSIGGAVAALYLGSDDAPPLALVSDRSLRTLPHTAYAIFRGPPSQLKPSQSTRERCRARLRCWVLAVGSCLAVLALRMLGWDMAAEDAWEGIKGRKVVLYHRMDHVIKYEAASLHAALERHGRLDEAREAGEIVEIEVTKLGGHGWGPHDFPLCYDEPSWDALISAVRWALGDATETRRQKRAFAMPRSPLRAM